MRSWLVPSLSTQLRLSTITYSFLPLHFFHNTIPLLPQNLKQYSTTSLLFNRKPSLLPSFTFSPSLPQHSFCPYLSHYSLIPTHLQLQTWAHLATRTSLLRRTPHHHKSLLCIHPNQLHCQSYLF